MPSGAALFANCAKQMGIDRIFTLVGDHLNEVLGALDRSGIDIVHMRHESGVTHAADAHARVTRRPALSLVTGGPGHTNSLMGVAAATLAGSPVIAVSGSRATSAAERNAFQDIDQIGMARSVVKWAAQPASADQIPFYMRRAFTEANSGRRGAVHLTIPVDLFTADARDPVSPPLFITAEPPSPNSLDIDRAARLIRAAERPIAIAGSGVWWSGAERVLQTFIETTGIPLYTITMARGAVSDEHPLCFGFADPALNRASLKAFQEADLFLILGKRIDYRLGLGSTRVLPSAAKYIQVDIHPQELGLNHRLDVPICADVRKTLEALVDAIGASPSDRPWLGRVQGLRSEWRETLARAAATGEPPLHPAAFFSELQRWLPPDTLLSWDGGDFTHWGRALTPALVPGGWLRLGPLGAIGSALPNAIALQLANPGKRVALITGDGALGFYIAELDTAVRYGLPLIIIVGNDAGWGLERELQTAAFAGAQTVACELRATRYDTIMEGFGGRGETVDSLEQVAPAVGRALAASRPYLINVNIRGVLSPFTEWQIEGKKSR